MLVLLVRVLTVVGSLVLAGQVHAQATGFDGVYRSEPVTGNGCSVFTPVLRVEKGAARMRFNPTITFEGDVGKDGSLEAPYGKNSLSGRFAGSQFQGSATTARCQYNLVLTR